MMDLAQHFPLLVEDEFELLARLVPLRGADVLDVGCGAGAMTARIATDAAAARVVGIDVDEAQLAKNANRSWPAAVAFQRAGAESLAFKDAAFDAATLFKLLHHIPADSMDAAFAELARVLRPGGLLYVSEPVYDGAFNDVMRLFHDKGVVRAQALEATERAITAGLFRLERRVQVFAPVAFRDFEDFRVRMMNPTHSAITMNETLLGQVRNAFEAHRSPQGAHFIRPVRVDLLARA